LFPHVFLVPQHSRTAIEAILLKYLRENHFINWQQQILLEIIKPYRFPDKIKELTVEVIAKLQVINPFDYFVEVPDFLSLYDQMLQQRLYLNLSE
jgi:hypothetical protein